MKKIIAAFTFVLLIALAETASAQLVRDMPRQGVSDATPSMVKPAGFFENFLGTAFDDTHFQMNHSYSLEFNSFIGTTIGEYTNTMIYKFDIPLTIRADVGVMHQPFGGGQIQGANGLQQNLFSGVYLKNAEVNYQPSENMLISVRFVQAPNGNPYFYGNPYYGGGRNGFGW